MPTLRCTLNSLSVHQLPQLKMATSIACGVSSRAPLKQARVHPIYVVLLRLLGLIFLHCAPALGDCSAHIRNGHAYQVAGRFHNSLLCMQAAVFNCRASAMSSKRCIASTSTLKAVSTSARTTRSTAVSVRAEISYVMIKPDGVQRGLVGSIISRFEAKGFQLKGLKMFQCPKELAEEHYSSLSEKPFFGALVNYIISGPVICMVRPLPLAAAQGAYLWPAWLKTFCAQTVHAVWLSYVSHIAVLLAHFRLSLHRAWICLHVRSVALCPGRRNQVT